jgi:hypothetical protein
MRPDFVALEKAARRERAEAVHRLLIKPLIGLFRHAPRLRRLVASAT